MIELREVYKSSNGDRWHLARDGGRLFVRHEANLASGGRVSDIDIAAFLAGGEDRPERRQLLDLIGTLVVQ